MNANIRHYKATVRNETLYVVETIALGRHRGEQLEKEKREILGRYLDQKRRKNNERTVPEHKDNIRRKRLKK